MNEKKIARVFITKTSMTPEDDMAFIDCPPPLLALPEMDEIHISVTFTWDMQRAEWLEKQWRAVGVPVKMGGPAFNKPGGEFEPGMYLKKGMVLTSRGCPNNCWFCAVPKREGGLRCRRRTGAIRLSASSVAAVINISLTRSQSLHVPRFSSLPLATRASMMEAVTTSIREMAEVIAAKSSRQ